MQSAIDLGNRILMMDSGNIVLDIGEEEKKNMTVDALLEKFKTGAGKALDNDTYSSVRVKNKNHH